MSKSVDIRTLLKRVRINVKLEEVNEECPSVAEAADKSGSENKRRLVRKSFF